MQHTLYSVTTNVSKRIIIENIRATHVQYTKIINIVNSFCSNLDIY